MAANKKPTEIPQATITSSGSEVGEGIPEQLLCRKSNENDTKPKDKTPRFLIMFTAKKEGSGLRYELLPVTKLNENIVGWDSQDDPDMPFNFTSHQKWTWVVLLSIITFLTPFSSSILSPAIGKLNEEFGNTNAIIGSMTVSIYLLGYVVGPIFIAPLSEIYGSKPVLTTSTLFFCIWQIGCALSSNITTLIVCRFFSGVGGAACLVGSWHRYIINMDADFRLARSDTWRQHHWRIISP